MRIIAGSYKGRTLKTTTGPGFRPAMGKVREALFSILEAHGVIWPETRIIDLFAGSGSLGFEALSRGAAFVSFVESSPSATSVIRKNATVLGIEVDRYHVTQEDVLKALVKRPGTPYNLVFIDPPYRIDAIGRTVSNLVKRQWLAPGAIINTEVEARLKLDPQKVHPLLELLDDRDYGQTRVLLWTLKA